MKVMSFDGHTTNVTSLGFQREGKWMYTGSEDGTVKIWDLRSDHPSRSLLARNAL
jgi:G protein beta subunit-like protein